mmetsp:Transcript_30038/g.42224  ORF Transcript_30038/g.42224 Transcript_30038/m.42224 type:complete len:274 (-) Transcript_30038:33-854(-)
MSEAEGFECLKKVHVSTEACIHFGDLKNPAEAIDRYLSTKVLRWFSHVDGILICFSNVQILNSKGRLVDESPYVFFPISFQALVFQPKEGQHLIGKVNETEPTYISFLVLGIFQGVILADQLASAKFTYDAKGKGFYRKGKEQKAGIKVGTIIKLKAQKVRRLGQDNRIQIVGTLDGVKDVVIRESQHTGGLDTLSAQITNMTNKWSAHEEPTEPNLPKRKRARTNATQQPKQAAPQQPAQEEETQEGQQEQEEEQQESNEVAENPETIELEI